jgi:adenylate kinase family enzyme
MKIDETLYRRIFERHHARLHHLEVPHPKVVVTFSAIAGSGKTTLAKAIEARYGAVRVSNDHIRRIIDELNLGLEPVAKQQLLEQYLFKLFEYLAEQPNGLILLDSSIDRKYFEVRDGVTPLGYRVVLIKISLPRRELERRIRVRDKSRTNAEAYLNEFDRWTADHRRLASRVKPDVTLTDDYNFDFTSIYAFLDRLVEPC